jgi:hypothetical protein
MYKAVVLILILLIISLAGVGILNAQSTNASITGYVTDPTKAVLPEAKVTVINTGTNARYAAATNKNGSYTVVNLSPGNYRVEVEKAGFRTVVKSDIVLHLQDAVAINFEMVVGSISEIVTVSAGASLINTQDGSVSTVIDQSYVANMPLNGRSFQDLILLTPGVVTSSPQSLAGLGTNGEFSVNGQRTESNYYTVDGVSANVGATADIGNVFFSGASGSLPGATALGTTQALVSVDDLQEFRVQSSTYSAEYGRNPGGQFAFETKSGTNQWHGTAYDYLRNDFFDANDWFNNYLGVKEAPLRQNDFGGTLGGPVRIPGLYNGKDKTFFFVSYEGLRLLQPQAASTNSVPDLCLRGTSAACAGTHTPAPAPLQPALNAFPLPSTNGQDFDDGLAQYIASWSNPSSIDSTSIRFDHVIKDKARLFFRFSDTSSNATVRGNASQSGLTPSVSIPTTSLTRTYTGGVSSLLSNRLSNELRFNYTSNEAKYRNVIDAFGGSTPVDLIKLSGLSGFGSGAAASLTLCYDGCFSASLSQLQTSGAQRQWNLVDTLALTLGRHQLKFGGDYRRLTPYGVPTTANLLYYYFQESDVVNNNTTFFSVAGASAYPLYRNFSAFAEDEWRVSSRLNVSLGLRWEVNPPPGVTQGLMPYTLQGSSLDTLTLAPQGTPLWKTTWVNFAPRLGMAYVIRQTPGWETVVRGGGGVFFDTGQQLGTEGFEGPGFLAFGPISPAPGGGAFPASGPSLIPAISQPPQPPYSGAYDFNPHLQLPYTLQWNASVEQALGKSQAFTASYVGSHASRLLQTNQFQPANNPNIGFLNIIQNGLTSDYNSLQLQFRRRLSQGLTVLGSYSWSHCLDYGSNALNIEYQRGNCSVDVRHNVSAAFSYDLPSVSGGGFVNAVLHHWGIDDRFTARTAFPIFIKGSDLPQPNGKIYNAGLDSVQNEPVYLYGENCATILQGLGDLQQGHGCPGGRAINPYAFTNPVCAPNSVCFGDVPRNFARGFGAWQMDLAVRREFPIHERLKLQFRAEAFNVFNHPNFGWINPSCSPNSNGQPGCTNPQFGQAQFTLASSLGVLSPQYQMGGPRSMQFALKLVF